MRGVPEWQVVWHVCPMAGERTYGVLHESAGDNHATRGVAVQSLLRHSRPHGHVTHVRQQLAHSIVALRDTQSAGAHSIVRTMSACSARHQPRRGRCTDLDE